MKPALIYATDVKVGMYIDGIDGWWRVTGVRSQGARSAVSWREGPAKKRYERLYESGAMVSVWLNR